MKKQLLFLFVFLSFHSIYAQLTATVTIISPYTCVQNAMVVVTASGGTQPYQYTLTGPISDTNTHGNFPNLIPGSYTATVTDALGATANQSFFIDSPAPIMAVATSSNVTCFEDNNGSIMVNANGGAPPYQFTLYSNSGAVIAGPIASGAFNGLPAGNYTATVTSSQGCTGSTFVTIVQPPAITAITSIEQNTITVNALGGNPPYQYSIEGGMFQSSNVFNVTQPGTYSVFIMDMNGCFIINTVTVPSNPNFSVSIFATLDIPTSSLYTNVTGGMAPYFYQWYKDGMFITSGTEDNLNILGQLGIFSVTVIDANGLTTSSSIIIEEATTPIANDDAFTAYPIAGSNSIIGNVLSNDSINSSILYILNPLTVPTGFTLDPIGNIGVLAGTPAGVYTLVYELCNGANPTPCDTATATITVAHEGIQLNAFIDANSNGVQDAGEPNFVQGQFGYELNNNGTINYVTSSNGEYNITDLNPTNSYDLTFTVNPAYASFYTATTSYNDVTVVPGSGLVVYNFPVTQVPFVDASVNIYGTAPRPGFTYDNYIMYRNSGNQTIASGTVTFNKDNAVSIVSVSQAGITNTVTGFTYDFTNLLAGEVRNIYVTMQVPTIPTINLGNILTNTAAVTIPAGDVYLSNNNTSISQIVVGSYDPNDMSELHGGRILHSAFTANDYLTYTIQFENTGTANAENVHVEDVLDAKLDETTIKMVDASHAYTLERTGNNLSWNFNGIELPPSVADTTIGHGYITFQIKPKAGYAVGDIIPNAADIYFDFNPAIVTNTYNTEFVTTLSVSEFENVDFTAYPNPTNGQLTIVLKNNTSIIDAVIVNDVLGKSVQTKNFTSSNAVLDLSNLTKGIYFVKVQSQGLEKVIKVVKQ